MKLTSTEQKILGLLAYTNERHLFGNEIARRLHINKGAASITLRKLLSSDLVKREKVGRDYFYTANHESALLRQWKVTCNIAELQQLIQLLSPLAEKIVLYGSCASGTDTQESDVDMLIITSRKKEAKDAAKSVRLRRVVKAKILSASEYLALRSKEPAFFGNISKGIVLWRAKHA